MKRIKRFVRGAISGFYSTFLSFPKQVECSLCSWTGRHFRSDLWHKHIVCPRCHTMVRHRLFIASLRQIDEVRYEQIIDGKRVLHFAPEDSIRHLIEPRAGRYATADYLRPDCDFRVDMSDMPTIKDQSFDIVIAFDVLEHVPDFNRGLDEIRRVLAPGGYAILTVPQKDGLETTYEDASIVTEEDRLKHFGQVDHLRIFGNDFATVVEGRGFSVLAVDENSFPPEVQQRFVLAPLAPSANPLATNHRKVFFCRREE
ncbi:MAG: class I SAM-dependent methyltransferase [Terracidiphilus sp.]|nr:class I SAM-dependent methyltransferase [Terracidiphilus sp.]